MEDTTYMAEKMKQTPPGTVYTDRDMQVASKFAYYDVPKDKLPCTLQELLQREPSIIEHIQQEVNDHPDNIYYQRELELLKSIESGESKYSGWTMQESMHDAQGTGFGACLLQTGDGRGIVAFRGSDNFFSDQFAKDWMESDAALVNNTGTTAQQDAAAKFLQDIDKKYHWDHYTLTGHSLGGNLAFHSAIEAPDSLVDRIDHVYSLEGPGFSQNYLDRNRDKIARLEGRLTHYSWDAVGPMLTQPDGTKERHVEGGSHNLMAMEVDETGRARDERRFNPGDERDFGFGVLVDALDWLGRILAPEASAPDVIEKNKKDPQIPERPRSANDDFLEDLEEKGVIKPTSQSRSLAKKNPHMPAVHGAPQVEGRADFRIVVPEMRAAEEQLRYAAREMGRADTAVASVRNSLTAIGAGFDGIRSRLRRAEDTLRGQAEKLNACDKAQQAVLVLYEGTEKAIIESCGGQ